MSKFDFDLLVATQTCILKQFSMRDESSSVKYGKASADNDSVSLCRGVRDGQFILCKRSGEVVLIDNFVTRMTITAFGEAMAGADWAETSEGPAIVCCTVNGRVVVVPFAKDEDLKDGKAVTLKVSAPDFKPLFELTVEKPVERICVSHISRNLMALGGKSNRLRVWDLKERKRVFDARNPPDNWLLLAQPVWVSALAFSSKDPNMIAVGTRYKQLQIYDITKPERRPVRQVELGEDSLTCVVFNADESVMAVANSIGTIFLVRTSDLKMFGRFHPSCAGSVRDIVFVRENTEDEPGILCAVGLDRFLYCYNLKTRRQYKKVYAKQRLSKVIVLARAPYPVPALAAAAEGEEEENQDGEMNNKKKRAKDDDDVDDEEWFGLKIKKKEEQKEVQGKKKKQQQGQENTAKHSAFAKAFDKIKSKKAKLEEDLYDDEEEDN